MSRARRTPAQTARDYASRPYRVTLEQQDGNSEQPWVAAVEELPGCSSRGKTPDEAAAGIQEAITAWVATALEEGREVPEPKPVATYSGRLLLRMPRTLHGELTRAAEREGVSLNQLITDVLSSAVGWQGRTASKTGRPGQKTSLTQPPGEEGLTTATSVRPERSSRSPSRLVLLVLAANFVIILLAAIVAIVVLLSTWF
jgi:antitoxin HicB